MARRRSRRRNRRVLIKSDKIQQPSPGRWGKQKNTPHTQREAPHVCEDPSCFPRSRLQVNFLAMDMVYLVGSEGQEWFFTSEPWRVRDRGGWVGSWAKVGENGGAWEGERDEREWRGVKEQKVRHWQDGERKEEKKRERERESKKDLFHRQEICFVPHQFCP